MIMVLHMLVIQDFLYDKYINNFHLITYIYLNIDVNFQFYNKYDLIMLLYVDMDIEILIIQDLLEMLVLIYQQMYVIFYL